MLIGLGQRRIHYDLVGDEAAPVVCLAHALSADGGIWAEQVPALIAAGWRALRIDMRGHGGSDAASGSYVMRDLADDVALVLDRLALPKVHFVGLSIGGMIGQTFAIAHPERLVSLMLSGTSPEALAGGMDLWRPRFEAINRTGSVEALADTTMSRWFTDAFRPRRPQRWLEIRNTIAATTLAGYVGGGMAINSFDVVGQLPSVSAPTLVVCGDDDQGTPPTGNKKIAALIHGARYREIARARHVPNVEYPDLFNSILTEWLASHRA